MLALRALFSNSGPCWRLLRERLAAETGAHCVPVASGTLGLMAAIATLAEPGAAGGEALMPSFTFAATAQAAIWAGLTPRFIDVDHAHWHSIPGSWSRSWLRVRRSPWSWR